MAWFGVCLGARWANQEWKIDGLSWFIYKLLGDSLLLIVSSLPICSWNLFFWGVVNLITWHNQGVRRAQQTDAISQVTRGSSSNRNNRDTDFPVPAARLLNRRQPWHVDVNGFSKKMGIWFWRWSKNPTSVPDLSHLNGWHLLPRKTLFARAQ